MRVLTSNEIDNVAGGTFGLLACLPKIKIDLSWCKPKAPVKCNPKPRCAPPPTCGEAESE